MKKKNLIRLQDIAFGTIAVSSLFLLVGASSANAATSAVDEITITIPASCSLTDTIGSAHTATIETGVYQDNIGETTFKVFCNDTEGFAVYAVGFTNDDYGNTTLKPATISQDNAIVTGTATSGDTSNWAMKLTAVSGDYAPTLETGFNDYHVIPDTYTKVASFASNTDATTGSSFKSTYAAFVSGTQIADSYTGKIKYTVIHPANEVAPITPVATMQHMDATISSETSSSVVCTSEPSYVVDSRDDHVYTIQRLADGNCWMMENLDLGRTELTVDLTSENTNLETTIPASTFNSWIKTSGTNSLTSGELIPISASNSSDGLEVDTVSGTPYGTLYNYCAASAGTICTSSNRKDAEFDICPAGWRLPAGGNRNEYGRLHSSYSSSFYSPIANNGVAFARAGGFSDGEPSGQGSGGSYWTSSIYSNAYTELMDALSFWLNTFYGSSGDSRKYGNSIRCILKEPTTISKLKYLQDFRFLSDDEKSSVMNSMEYNTTYNLIDNRDGHSYATAKLKDGHIWMAENLDLGRTALRSYFTLTSNNTNISTNIEASTFNSWIKSSGTGSYTSAELIPVTGTDSTSNTPYGTLYNYCAASAGTICSEENANNNDATSDLCPAGWRLPTGGSNGEFGALSNLTDYNTSAKMRTSITGSGAAFALAGYISSSAGSAPAGQGSYGYYWSSTRYDNDRMNLLCLTTSVLGSGAVSRLAGYAVRCIADI